MPQRSRGEGHKKIHAVNTGTTAGTSVTLSGAPGTVTVLTYVAGSSDAAAVVTIQSPSGTTLWKKRFTAAFTFSETFSFGEYEAAAGNDIVMTISASTANCEANMAGLQVGL